jgi:transcription elongation GreA/GreB family factor
MSRAFTREPDADAAAAADVLPDRPISSETNFVTATGLAEIEATLQRLTAARSTAAKQRDVRELAVLAREQRYWAARLASARLIDPGEQPQVARFGVRISLQHPDGTRLVFRIVGEDEADPAAGKLSFVSPVARSLLGARLGDQVSIAGRELEVVALAGSEPAPLTGAR